MEIIPKMALVAGAVGLVSILSACSFVHAFSYENRAIYVVDNTHFPNIPAEMLSYRRSKVEDAYLGSVDSSECITPETPKGMGSGRNWEYGCFCGENIPHVDVTLRSDQRLALYRAISPKDSIDRLCKNHDICLLLFGPVDDSCTRIFVHDIGENLRNYLIQRKAMSNNDSRDHHGRCIRVLGEIYTAFASPFIERQLSSGKGQEWATLSFVLLASPFMGVFEQGSEYPSNRERCEDPTF